MIRSARRTSGDGKVSEMRTAVVGAGAIGGTIAGKLLRSGVHDVSILARGKTLEEIRRNGLCLFSNDIETQHPVRTSDKPADLGVHDLVILAVKGNSLPPLAASLRPFLSPETVIISAQNGIPWWFDIGLENAAGAFPLTTVDPNGHIRDALAAHRILGCVVSFPAKVISPGVIEHASDRCQITIGTPDQRLNRAEVMRIASALSASGISTEVTDDVRCAMWAKLALNLFFGSISILTGANIGKIQDEASLDWFRAKVIAECAEIARAWGTEIDPHAQNLQTWRTPLADWPEPVNSPG